MKRTLLLLLALLCMLPAAHAAGPETLYPIAYCFRETDFRADTLSDLNGIFVTSVPEADVATICLGERVIRAGDVLPVSVLGELELLPVSTGGQEAALCYCPIRGTALGEPAQVTIRIRSAKDAAPKADDAELETYKNIPNDGRLTGSDPEDTNLTFQLAEEPKRGKVELQENGSFVYTPAKNKVGEDSFTFTVTDAAGNVSHPATVRITVKKPSECRAFADLTGSLDQFEAMWTAAAGLTGGRSIGGTLCYLPQETVSRAEFLVMAMELLDVPVDDTLRVSGPISPQPCAAASSTAWSPSAASSSARMSRSRPGRPPSCCRTCWSSPSPQPSPRRTRRIGRPRLCRPCRKQGSRWPPRTRASAASKRRACSTASAVCRNNAPCPPSKRGGQFFAKKFCTFSKFVLP